MIKAIMAEDTFNGVGRNGTLPWPKNSEDLKFFQEHTTGHIIVMGSNTWKDPCMPAPLKNRKNIVVSTQDPDNFTGAYMVINGDIQQELIDLDFKSDSDIWIIGGAQLVADCAEIIEEFYITEIKGDFKCDVKLNFPFRLYDMEKLYHSRTTNSYFKYTRQK